ncbi:MAG: hypothetical protein KAW45_06855 [Thermoplasmatales archaeon]|nr:hypothetical protein [Thermoplasmatales archaeon]
MKHSRYDWIALSENGKYDTFPGFEETCHSYFSEHSGWGSRGGGEER